MLYLNKKLLVFNRIYRLNFKHIENIAFELLIQISFFYSKMLK
ncbi:hypothetical protein L289_0585 [Acinetobacter gerneri DSM 14967 = CIP 107464 = MTCC 9824]|nr:hypothetical protein L289_0585 [Acinetobacter gerneri DSM 14967 = CIP 107464 = MTCC 9824]